VTVTADLAQPRADITCEAIIWVGLSSARKILVAAAMPELNSSASSAPSKDAIRLCVCCTDKLSVRP